MDSLETPKRDRNALDNNAIFETPLPQATSTATKRVAHPRMNNDQLNETNQRCSSLGILENINELTDIGDLEYEIQPNRNKIRESLEYQRKLAENVLKRTSLSKSLARRPEPTPLSSKLPSYFLQSEYMSDVEYSSFTLNKSGDEASSIQNSELKGSPTVSISEAEHQRKQSLMNDIAKLEKKLAMFRSPLQQESVEEVPVKDTDSKRLRGPVLDSNLKSVTEMESEKVSFGFDQCSFPTYNLNATESNENFVAAEEVQDKLFQDDFAPNVNISKFTEVSLREPEQSIGEFFRQRCEEPNFSLEVTESNPKSRTPMGLLFDDSYQSEANTSLISHTSDPKKSLPTPKNSTLSLSTIAKALSEMNGDNPDKMINQILKNYQKRSNENKENINTLNSSEQSTARLYRTSTKSDLIGSTGGTDTLKLISESPSRTFSELNLSPVSKTQSPEKNKKDSWISIKSKQYLVWCNTPMKNYIEMHSQDRWVKVTITVGEIRLSNGFVLKNTDGILHYKLPVPTVLLEPNGTVSSFEIQISTLIEAKIELILNLSMSDMRSGEIKEIKHSVEISSVYPKVSTLGIINDVLDFDIVGDECCVEKSFTICNETSIEVPLFLSLEKQDGKFSLVLDEHQSGLSKMDLNLPARSKCTLTVKFTPPKISEESREFTDKLYINVGQQNFSRIVQEIVIKARVVHFNLEFLNNGQPITVNSGNSQFYIPIRNSCSVPMHLTAKILTDDFHQASQCSTVLDVEPDNFTLGPGNQMTLNITFNDIPTKSTNRILILTEKSGIEFKLPLPINIIHERTRSKSPLSWCFPTSTQSPPFSRVSSRNSDNSDQKTGTIKRPPSASSAVSSTVTTGEKIPLESSKIELIWGCVKIGKSSSDDFVIKNSSSRKLKLIATISGSNFKFQKDLSDYPSSLNLVLQGNETRALTIVFSPNRIGGVKGKISMSSPSWKKQKVLRLFGYGGHSNMELMGISKDISGNIWFSMGTCGLANILKNNFNVRNSGSLPSFVYVKISDNSFMSIDEPSVTISPNKFVLQPSETRQLTVIYNMKKNFNTLFQSKEVASIGFIDIATGPEPSRFRIRYLLNHLKLMGKYEAKYESLAVLNTDFENEKIPHDVDLYKKETPDAALLVLQKQITTYHIKITVEKSCDQTRLALEDETVIFNSMCEDQTTLAENSMFHQPSETKFSNNKCYVNPNVLIFSKSVTYNQFKIISDHNRRMPFQIELKSQENLQIAPNCGEIPANGYFTVGVSLPEFKAAGFQSDIGIIMVYVENEVLLVNLRKQFH